MANILCKTFQNENPRGKARVYFTCHPKDFDRYFERICKSIFKTHDCAIYYTEDMSEPIPEQDLDTDVGSNNLMVIPVTRRLLTEENRAMDKDFRYAQRVGMPVLPIMMEPELDILYSKPGKFGTLQYLSVISADATAISYEEKLKKFLDNVLISDETAKRIRDAFDAYIFLSYRKADRGYANELMRMIHRNPQCYDIAVWYDEFLTPGESFLESIDKILHNSRLFTLLVTPKLLEEPDGKPNFVMAKEYPAAKASGIDILPVEMKPTDRAVLSEKYKGIPQCVPAGDDAAFQKALTEAIHKIAITTNNTDPEHTFLIGLAYLGGIDVEKDPERGLELIKDAAENRLPEAMKMLSRVYDFRPNFKYRCSALPWAERYWEYCEQAYGEKHPETLEAMNLTVQALGAADYTEEALCLCRKVYALRCEVLGEAHPDTLDTLLYLADKLVRSQTKKAVQLYEKANSPMAACWGPESGKFCNYLRGMAEVCIKLGDAQKALGLYDRIYILRRDIADKDDTIVMDALERMVEICWELDDRQKILELREKAYAHQCKVFGEEDPRILRSLDALAGTYEERGKHSDAMELHKKAYALRCKVFGEGSENVSYYMERLARTYSGYEDWENVLALQEKIYANRCNTYGEEDPKTLNSLDAMAETYEQLGKYSSATELHRKAYAIRCGAFGEDSEWVIRYLIKLGNTYSKRGESKNENKWWKIRDALEEKACRKQEAARMEKAPGKQEAAWVENTQIEEAAKPAPGEPSASDTGKDSYWQGKPESVLGEYTVSSKYLGDENSKPRRLMAELAWCYERTGNTREAVALYKKICSIHEKLGNGEIVQALKDRMDILEGGAAGIPGKRKLKNTVYLIPCGDRAYRPGIWEQALDDGALALADEGSYPVKVTWTRLDLNCDIVWDEQTCEDDADLLELLDFLGAGGFWIEDMEFLGEDDREEESGCLDEDDCSAEEQKFLGEDDWEDYSYEEWEALYAQKPTVKESDSDDFLAKLMAYMKEDDRSVQKQDAPAADNSSVEAPKAPAADALSIEEMMALFADEPAADPADEELKALVADGFTLEDLEALFTDDPEDIPDEDDPAFIPLDAIDTSDFTAEELAALFGEDSEDEAQDALDEDDSVIQEPDDPVVDDSVVEEPEALDAGSQAQDDPDGYAGGEGLYRTCRELFDDCYGRQKEEIMAEMMEINDDYADQWLYGKIYDT